MPDIAKIERKEANEIYSETALPIALDKKESFDMDYKQLAESYEKELKKRKEQIDKMEFQITQALKLNDDLVKEQAVSWNSLIDGIKV